MENLKLDLTYSEMDTLNDLFLNLLDENPVFESWVQNVELQVKMDRSTMEMIWDKLKLLIEQKENEA
jgi:hypothetical protein